MKKTLIIFALILGAVVYVFAQQGVITEPGQTITTGQTKVVTPYVAVPLTATSTRVLSVQITNLPSNIRPQIYIGSSTVTVLTSQVIASGSVISLAVQDLANVYVIAEKASEGVSYIAIVR